MDYKERYNAALERMKSWVRGEHPECFSEAQKAAEFIFPELKESEDEQSKKWILEYLYDGLRRTDEQFKDQFKAAIAWIEKQSEQEPYGQRKECEDCQFNYAGKCKGFCQMKRNEQKPADNVEPKFHIGEWLQYRNAKPFFVEEITEQGYCNGVSCLPFEWEDEIHLWSINDAKDGDVLAAKGKGGQEVGIVKEFIGKYGGHDKCFETYCYSDLDGIFRIGEYMGGTSIHPATKEQRDLLFQKMADAGYRWNKVKLKLEKL